MKREKVKNKKERKMSIYFSISVWKFSFSVSINGVVNNKKN